MRYGFIIDQRKCIGCHACTVACKQENGVALGNFRTWVKYTEKGAFPNVTRNFLVERCNHCDDAPCVNICPVTALWKREDGIVDFSGDRCIGCRSCMAACPYDAIYIDPESHTIGKCNYCAHRVDIGLQPACVNVCPVEAIITGDLDDPQSRIATLLSLEPAVVRRPEKGTKPKLFYLGADDAAVSPEATSERSTYMWAQSDPEKPIRITDSIGYVPSGMVQRDYAIAHQQPWGWHVAAYLWTKSIAAGSFLVAAFLLLLGGTADSHSCLSEIAPLIALIFLGLTNVLLVLDLERPERFWRVVFWPNWSSWLVLGAYILAGYGALLIASGGAALFGASALHRILLWPTSFVAAAAAAYTAFLFAQAKGRDLWQNPLLPAHLVIQAVLAGAAVMAILAFALDGGAVHPLAIILAAALGLQLVLALAELLTPHVTAQSRQAVVNLTRGSAGRWYWGSLLAGAALAGLLSALVAGGMSMWVIVIAAVLALAGLAIYEDRYVAAGQSVPLS